MYAMNSLIVSALAVAGTSSAAAISRRQQHVDLPGTILPDTPGLHNVLTSSCSKDAGTDAPLNIQVVDETSYDWCHAPALTAPPTLNTFTPCDNSHFQWAWLSWNATYDFSYQVQHSLNVKPFEPAENAEVWVKTANFTFKPDNPADFFHQSQDNAATAERAPPGWQGDSFYGAAGASGSGSDSSQTSSTTGDQEGKPIEKPARA